MEMFQVLFSVAFYKLLIKNPVCHIYIFNISESYVRVDNTGYTQTVRYKTLT